MGTAIRPQDIADWYALVADDDEDSRALVAAICKEVHLHVCEACDGDELIERYRAIKALGNMRVVVVSDVGMPGTDGIAATQQLRRIAPDLPIVLVTAFRDLGTLGAALRAGANKVLPKPVAREELQMAVQELLRHAREQAPPAN